MPWANPRHQPKRAAQQREREQFRGSASSRGYDRHHQAWRLLVLAGEPTCVGWPRGVHGEVPVGATVADHIIPLREWRDPVSARRQLALVLASIGQPLMAVDELGAWSLENGAGLCASCHGRKSRTER